MRHCLIISDIDTTTLYVYRQFVDLKTQVRYYKNVRDVLRKKLGNEEAKSLLSRSVNLFSVGSNDYGARFVSNISVLQRYSKHQFVDIVIGNITEAIKVRERESVCVCFVEINDQASSFLISWSYPFVHNFRCLCCFTGHLQPGRKEICVCEYWSHRLYSGH